MSQAPRVVLDTNVALSELEYLVTGDWDLLSLEAVFSQSIVMADQLMNALAKA